MPDTKPIEGGEIRYDEIGTLDELVMENPRFVHIERMDEGQWWVGITDAKGEVLHVNLFAGRRGRIEANAYYG